MNDSKLNGIRRATLDSIDKSRKRALLYVVIGGIFEAVILLALMMMMEPGDRTHKVIFLAACLVYCPLAFGLFALRSWIDLAAQRILKALDAVGEGTA